MAGSAAYPSGWDTDAVLLKPNGWLDNTDAGDDAEEHPEVPEQVGDFTQWLQDMGAIVRATQRGSSWKKPVRAASTANVSTGSPGATMDGVTLSAGDRVLLKDQTVTSLNGIWKWNGAAVGLTREPDLQDPFARAGAHVGVEEGDRNGESVWVLVTNNPIEVGITNQRWTRAYPTYASDAVSTSSPYSDRAGFLPANAKIENPARHLSPLTNLSGALASGTVRVSPLGVLRAGDTLSSVTFFSGTTAAATPTNQWAGIARLSDRQIVAISPSAGSAAWAANSAKTFTFGTPFTADRDELLVAFLMVAATTVPTLLGVAHGNAVTMGNPVICGSANTGQTTPLANGATLSAFTAVTPNPYCYAS